MPHRPADDLTLSTKVKIELLADPALGALRLDVSTLNGVVTLSGTVPSQAEADRAAAAAKRVHGVRGVKTLLTVRSPQLSLWLAVAESSAVGGLESAAGKLSA